MGGLALVAALLCFFLPETKGMPTVEVYENNGTVLVYILRGTTSTEHLTFGFYSLPFVLMFRCSLGCIFEDQTAEDEM